MYKSTTTPPLQLWTFSYTRQARRSGDVLGRDAKGKSVVGEEPCRAAARQNRVKSAKNSSRAQGKGGPDGPAWCATRGCGGKGKAMKPKRKSKISRRDMGSKKVKLSDRSSLNKQQERNDGRRHNSRVSEKTPLEKNKNPLIGGGRGIWEEKNQGAVNEAKGFYYVGNETSPALPT